MAYCRNCGQQIDNNAFICIHCGVLTGIDNRSVENDGTTLGIIGLCFALLMPLVTWIVSGIGISYASKANNETGKTLNLIALIVSSIVFLLYLIWLIFIISISVRY